MTMLLLFEAPPVVAFNETLQDLIPKNSLSVADAKTLSHAFQRVVGSTGATAQQVANLTQDMNDLAKVDSQSPQPVFLATNDYSMSVWNDVRNAADCHDVDVYRQALHDEAVGSGQTTAEPEEPRGAEDRRHAKPEPEESGPEPPDVQAKCAPNFGNSDIYGASLADPSTP